MTHRIADMVEDTTVTTGAGALVLAGAVNGRRAVADVPSIADNDTIDLTVILLVGATITEWQTAKWQYDADTGSITAVEIYDSSNGGSAVSFSVGLKYAVGAPIAAQMLTRHSGLAVDAPQSLSAAEQAQGRANISAAPLAAGLIINGGGQVNQRTYTTVADDTYWCDRHYVLTQTNTITPTIITDVADGLPTMMRLTQTQASAQRMGNATIIESKDAKEWRGKAVTLMAKVRCSASTNIRFAILEWTGSADAPTSDVVNDWTSSTYTGGNFFVSSNFTVRAVGVQAVTANTMALATLTATLGSSFTNLIFVYWTESTAAQNVTLDLAWDFVEGDASAAVALPVRRHIRDETALCQWFWRPLRYSYQAYAAGASVDYLQTVTFSPMRTTPSVSVITAGTPSNVSSNIHNALSDSSVAVGFQAVGAGTTAILSRVIGLSAEL